EDAAVDMDWVATTQRNQLPFASSSTGRLCTRSRSTAGMRYVSASHASRATQANARPAAGRPVMSKWSPTTFRPATKVKFPKFLAGESASAANSRRKAVARQQVVASRRTRAAAAIQNRISEGSGRPDWRSAAETIPVAITKAKHDGGNPATTDRYLPVARPGAVPGRPEPGGGGGVAGMDAAPSGRCYGNPAYPRRLA